MTIRCNSANEYYIDKAETLHDEALRSWVLDSYAMRSLLDDNRDIAAHIHVESVPSAREFLAPVLRAIRSKVNITFDYTPFNRLRADTGIEFSPYFVKLFRQRWYMVGLRTSDAQIRTYALDRVSNLALTAHEFSMPEGLTANDYFADLFGITQSHAPAAIVKLRVEPETSKFLRALPLHASQSEEQFSEFSIFTYKIKITDDFIRHLLSLGPKVEVLLPESLRLLMAKNLKEALSHYE